VPFLLVGGDDVALPETIRSEDVPRILLALTGEPLGASGSLEPDELWVSERLFRTYQKGRFKSLWERSGGHVLIDLAQDPGETQDVSAAHPDVVDAHRRRVESLAASLAAEGLPADAAALDPQWLERLRSLGYAQ
jgi:hypothetical protein